MDQVKIKKGFQVIMNKKANLAEQLDGAKYVKYCPEEDITFAWHGGHGIHIYDKSGTEIDFFNVGDFSVEEASVGDIAQAVEEKINEYKSDIQDEGESEELEEEASNHGVEKKSYVDNLDSSEEEEIDRVQEIAESYINGNISWVREEVGSDLKLFNDVYEYIQSFNPEEADSFRRTITANNKGLNKKAASDLEIQVLYVTSNHSVVVKVNDINHSDVAGIEEQVGKEMMEEAQTDDFWIDDAWVEKGDMEIANQTLIDIITGGQGSRLNQDAVNQVFSDPEYPLKASALVKWGYDVSQEAIDEIQVYKVGDESWIEGNFQEVFPDGWLYEEITNTMNLPEWMETNYVYFEDGFARMLSDNVPNGDAKYDRIGDYFVYTYNVRGVK